MISYNIRNRDKLLSDIVEGIKALKRGRARGDWHPSITLEHINVTLLVGEEVVLDTDFETSLEYLASDLYWDENGDWSDATSAKVTRR